jgi:FMN-dependent NADH-azoreductase
MTTILHIDSSILGGYSISRTLTAGIVAKQQALHPGARIIRRDLVVDATFTPVRRTYGGFPGW